MANAMKKAVRSQRSYRSNKNFRQFAQNAITRAEEREKIKLSRLIAEQLKQSREKKNKDTLSVTYSDVEDDKKENE